ncbi:hypothetical protein EVAR_99849_1 [Eumeta japonica]|uniref:Uncharacterized protein n=1 Tax=Eumeta variegata TaxID=151549 RepID=A0A4C2A7M0_EUMVA|nr:hypothetical protein EVAR_99849_1 [Eumeta japonica]
MSVDGSGATAFTCLLRLRTEEEEETGIAEYHYKTTVTQCSVLRERGSVRERVRAPVCIRKISRCSKSGRGEGAELLCASSPPLAGAAEKKK